MSTNTPNFGGKQAPLIERINDLQGRANAPMTCPRCGGAWFYKTTVEQFSDAGYGSAQFRSLTMTPETAYVCLCGTIVENKETVGRGVESRHGQFLNAVRSAMEHQKRNSVQAVAASCASLEEVEMLRSRVGWLETALASYRTDQTPVEEEPVPVQAIEVHEDVAYAPVGPDEKISQPATRTGRPTKSPAKD